MQSVVTWPYMLRRGHSHNPAEGACAMDAINWLVHGKHGDMPPCVCPVIAGYVIRGNDEMPDDIRQRLLPFLPRIAGTRSPAHERTRVRIILMANYRVIATRALDAAGMSKDAERLRQFPDDLPFDRAIDIARHVADRNGLRERPSMLWVWETMANVMRATRAWSVSLQHSPTNGLAAETTVETVATIAAYDLAAWDDYFTVLDQALNAGPQGEPWSASMIETGNHLFRKAGGLAPVL